ncbi:hypothetical protein Pdw03_0971 [Penicillium digitatum]|uniref:Uncharacterized protein n=3 Tax=Penicillium digitatum TaxID=36651 RepID=K9FGK6_PEND2|nr:hypothetical protein PDIP_44090 [Penicillium digitatum Pd1]EKV07287.1 hypothetical protein PDIG_73620 [Penicillium digitatum PHI26]EKV14365.1 hypothetical protein PDIP_44090 [Penicillium digitatum Pd1]KAG0159824.1 hypothetical protein PDIDSM_7351 [Penicillium digitatum]QQK46073.1 hypothetical protein Pdw03_0971 [Penicillium digitatum]
MVTTVPAKEIDELAAGIRSIMVEPEILISLHDGDLMARPIINPTSRAPAISVPLDALPSYCSNGTFVFEEPKALEAYFGNTGPTRATATKLRLVPLHHFVNNPFPFVSLDLLSWSGWNSDSPDQPGEICKFLDHALIPHDFVISAKGQVFIDIVDGWRAASRAAPHGHEVEEITFDLFGSGRLCPSYISRLLQHVSTVLAVKARGPFHSRLCDDESYHFKQDVVGSLTHNRLYMQLQMQQYMLRFFSVHASTKMEGVVPGG